jgi:hypothetical protein
MASINMFSSSPASKEAANAIAASGCGRLIAAGTNSGGIAVFDLSTLSNRKCLFWSRLDSTPVVSIAAHPSLPVFCITFASNYVVFLSVTAVAVNVIGRTSTDVRIHSVHWLESGSPGHVILLLRDSSFLRLTCPVHDAPHNIHGATKIQQFDPQQIRVSSVVSSLTGDITAIACRLAVPEINFLHALSLHFSKLFFLPSQ